MAPKIKKSSKKKSLLINYNKIKGKTENKNLPKKVRHYGIDLARIVSMIFIINHHIIHHGLPFFQSRKISEELKIFVFLNIIGYSGVDIFGMISGFVGFHSHKYSNLLNILLTAFFYNYGIAYFLKNYWLKLTINDMNHYLFPVFITDYWYVTAYFSMYFLLPIINKGINAIEQKDMKYFLILVFLFYSCLGQINFYFERFKSKDIFGFRNGFIFSWLIILYLFGSYYGKFKKNVEKFKIFFYLKYFFIAILFLI